MTRTALVLGGGINGLATAWALTRRGVAVTVVDRGAIPNPWSASFDHHRVIRAHYPGRPGLAARVGEAHGAWARMFADMGGGPFYVETGALAVSCQPGDWADRAREALETAGLAHDVLDPGELGRRYPHFDVPGARYALVAWQGGALLSDRILEGLAAWLREAGAALVEDFAVAEIDAERGLAAARDGRTREADTLVACLGLGTGPLLGEIFEAAFEPRRCLVAYVAPPADLRANWEASPCWVDLGGSDDCWGIPPVAGLPPKLGLGASTRVLGADEAAEREATEADGRAVLEGYRGRLARVDDYRVLRTVANVWTLAPGEALMVRRRGRLLATAIDSGHGFKFGALTGEDLAEAVLDPARTDHVTARIAGTT